MGWEGKRGERRGGIGEGRNRKERIEGVGGRGKEWKSGSRREREGGAGRREKEEREGQRRRSRKGWEGVGGVGGGMVEIDHNFLD